jgi:hypothetical protein
MDFGSGVGRILERRKGPRWAVEAAALLGMVGLICAIPALIGYATWADLHAMKVEWTIAGPPCPVVAKPGPMAVGRKKPRTFEYGGVSFTRSFGAVSCVSIPEDGLSTRENYRVCQFNNPGAVTVEMDGGTTVFQPPVGRRATVTVRHGRASCVVGGWFNY